MFLPYDYGGELIAQDEGDEKGKGKKCYCLILLLNGFFLIMVLLPQYGVRQDCGL